MQKELYWSIFANDYDKRVTYAVGEQNIVQIEQALALLTGLGKTLELGCGQGHFGYSLQKQAELLAATDLSREMLDVAKSRLAEYPHVNVEQSDCLDLHYNDNLTTTYL